MQHGRNNNPTSMEETTTKQIINEAINFYLLLNNDSAHRSVCSSAIARRVVERAVREVRVEENSSRNSSESPSSAEGSRSSNRAVR